MVSCADLYPFKLCEKKEERKKPVTTVGLHGVSSSFDRIDFIFLSSTLRHHHFRDLCRVLASYTAVLALNFVTKLYEAHNDLLNRILVVHSFSIT